MVIGLARVVLHLPGARSLKDKRQVVKSLTSQVQGRFAIAVAEVDEQDHWQVAVLGLAYVSSRASHCEEVIAKAVNFIGSRKTDAYIGEYQTETLHAF